MMEFSRTFSGAPWESQVGYCRAIRAGNQIYVTGTAATAEDGTVFAPGNAYRQTKRCFAIIEQALQALGADLNCVVRTRMFVTDINRWQEFGQAHREVFADHPPATTMVEIKRLIEQKNATHSPTSFRWGSLRSQQVCKSASLQVCKSEVLPHR